MPKKYAEDAGVVHRCEEYEKIVRNVRDSELIEFKAHGPAMEESFYNFGDSGYFWTDNCEYTTAVRFCPFCGLKLSDLL